MPVLAEPVCKCLRCGASGHVAKACSMSFMRPLCTRCDRLGHVAADCPMRSREERREARWRRDVERDARTEEARSIAADVNRLEWQCKRVAIEAARRCWKCAGAGHLARECVARLPAGVARDGAGGERRGEPDAAKDSDALSESTEASSTDVQRPRRRPLNLRGDWQPPKCSYCGEEFHLVSECPERALARAARERMGRAS